MQAVYGGYDHPAGYSLPLARIATSAERAIGDALRSSGIKLDEWRALDHLARTGTSTMTDLAEAILLTGPTLTRTVDRLVSASLVYRTVDLSDRRRVLVNVTRRGRATHGHLTSRVVAAEREVLETMTGDTADLLASLSRMAGGGQRSVLDGEPQASVS